MKSRLDLFPFNNCRISSAAKFFSFRPRTTTRNGRSNFSSSCAFQHDSMIAKSTSATFLQNTELFTLFHVLEWAFCNQLDLNSNKLEMSEYNGCFVEDEIDASNVFKQAASNLSTVNNLDDSLNRFGYNSDDRIERRELVLMYSSIKGEMEKEIHDLAHDSAYDSAKEMRSRLTGLKSDFGALQTNGAKLIRDDQMQLFDKGASRMLGETRLRHTREMEQVEQAGEELRRDLAKTHEIQKENLEKTLMRQKLPHTKYSKRLIELFKAESGLIKLCEYEEARKVRNMIDKILPGEVKKNEEVFEQSKQAARAGLVAAQLEDVGRLEEKIKAMVWKDKRRRETEHCREEQRVTNNRRDMTHAHCLEGRLRAEMSVKPSALWQKRGGYQSTSSSLRGQQLLDAVRGNKDGAQAVFADSLVDKHDYSGSLSGTV